jgi:hemoglobin/transferrin/lactoferrin receptor protein
VTTCSAINRSTRLIRRAVLAVRYEAPASNWGTELALTAVEAQRRVDRSRADLYRTDGYATLDWLVQWNVAPRLRLNAGVFNLADASSIEWADVRGRIAADPLIPYYTRAGRNASVSLTYQF